MVNALWKMKHEKVWKDAWKRKKQRERIEKKTICVTVHMKEMCCTCLWFPRINIIQSQKIHGPLNEFKETVSLNIQLMAMHFLWKAALENFNASEKKMYGNFFALSETISIARHIRSFSHFGSVVFFSKRHLSGPFLRKQIFTHSKCPS